MADHWERSAARENARRVAKAPLLAHAGLVPLVSPEERQRRMEAHRAQGMARLDEMHERARVRAAEARAALAARLDAPTLARVERYLSAFPEDFVGTMAAHVLARLDAGQPALAEDQAPTPERIAEVRGRIDRLLAFYNAPTREEAAALATVRSLDARETRTAYNKALRQLADLRLQRWARTHGAPVACKPVETMTVRVILDGQEHTISAPRTARHVEIPGTCKHCGASPLRIVGAGLVDEGPGYARAQAFCEGCERSLGGRVEATWTT